MPQLRLEYWPLGLLAVVLIAAAISDVRRGKIENYVTLPTVALGLIGHMLVGGLFGLTDGDRLVDFGLVGSLAGLAVGFLPMLVVWMAGGIGGGDAKLMAAVGAVAGWRLTLDTLFYGLLVAVVMSFVVMIRRRILVATLKRVARFVYLAFSPNKPGDPATKDSPKIPFGMALCAGAAIALIVKVLGWGELVAFSGMGR